MILITGSKGLIGRSLAKFLSKQAISYQEFDNKLEPAHPHYGDVCSALASQVNLDEIEGVVHLAAISRVILGEKNPELCWLTNVMGTYNVLSALFNTKHKPWVIYASSREVYGQQTKFPVTEQAQLVPLNQYAFSKLSAETMVNTFKKRGLKTQILRFSSVYGCLEDHPDRVIPAFCSAAVAGLPLRIDGRDTTLDFTHVDDVVKGIFKTIEALKTRRELPPAMHLTSGKATSLYDLVEMLATISGNKLQYADSPPRNYDVTKFYGDPSLAYEKLAWQPQIKLETGIAQLMEEFSSR